LITPADILMIVNFANGGGVAEGEYAGSGERTTLSPRRVDVLPLVEPLPQNPLEGERAGASAAIDILAGERLVPRARRSLAPMASPSRHTEPLARRETWERLSASDDSAWWLEQSPRLRRR
jgi:hypothetical protein